MLDTSSYSMGQNRNCLKISKFDVLFLSEMRCDECGKFWKNSSKVWVLPSYSRPWTAQMLQFTKFTDFVCHQKYKTTGLDTMWARPISFSLWWLLDFFRENLKAKRVFEKILKSEKILRNHTPDTYSLICNYIKACRRIIAQLPLVWGINIQHPLVSGKVMVPDINQTFKRPLGPRPSWWLKLSPEKNPYGHRR